MLKKAVKFYIKKILPTILDLLDVSSTISNYKSQQKLQVFYKIPACLNLRACLGPGMSVKRKSSHAQL